MAGFGKNGWIFYFAQPKSGATLKMCVKTAVCVIRPTTYWFWCLRCIVVLLLEKRVLRMAVITSFMHVTYTTECILSTAPATTLQDDLCQSWCQEPQWLTSLIGCASHLSRSVGRSSIRVSCFIWYSRHRLLLTMFRSGTMPYPAVEVSLRLIYHALELLLKQQLLLTTSAVLVCPVFHLHQHPLYLPSLALNNSLWSRTR